MSEIVETTRTQYHYFQLYNKITLLLYKYYHTSDTDKLVFLILRNQFDGSALVLYLCSTLIQECWNNIWNRLLFYGIYTCVETNECNYKDYKDYNQWFVSF